jgi:tRNA threonylcarbamoyladenosine modification (KEOPS) complex  Pcc1 subunit
MKAEVRMVLSELSIEDKKNILKLFELEDKDFSKRATYKILSERDNIVFEIIAKDATALRACITAITKTLSIYQRVDLLVKEEDNE